MIILNQEKCTVCQNSLGFAVQYLSYFYCTPCNKKLCDQCGQQKNEKCPTCSKVLRKKTSQIEPKIFH